MNQEATKTEEIVYRKVSVKERLPEKIEYYFTSVGLMYFNGNAFEAANLKHEYVDYWLEEIPRSSLIEEAMPANHDIEKETEKYAYPFNHGVQHGIKWLRSRLTGKQTEIK